MANIVTRLTLEGAAAIKAELASLGATGKKAWADLGDAQGMTERLKEAGVSAKDLAGHMAKFGGAARDAGQAGAQFGASVNSALGRIAIAAGLAVAAVVKIGHAFADVGSKAEALQQDADAIGVNREAYESLTNALGANGIRSEEAGKGLQKVAQFARTAKDQFDSNREAMAKLDKEYRKGSMSVEDYNERKKELAKSLGSAAQLVDRYGIKLKDASGELKNSAELALEFGSAMSKAGMGTQTLADGIEVFGRGGRKFVSVFGQGREAMEKMMARAKALAPSLSEEAAKAVGAMDDSFDQLGQTANSLKREVVSVFAGQATGVVTTFTEAIARCRGMFIRFAENIRDQVGPALVDLILFMDSPDFSLTMQNALINVRDGAIAVGAAFRDFVIPALKFVKQFADQVAEGLNNMFGTKFTGGQLIAVGLILKFSGVLGVLVNGIKFAVSAARALWFGLQVLWPIFRAGIIAAGGTGIAIIAIAIAIGTLVGLLIRYWPQIKQFFQEAFIATVDAVKAKWNGFVEFMGSIVQGIVNAWNGFVGFLKGIWDQAMANAETNWNAVKEVIMGIIQPIIDKWNEFTGWISSIWNGIVQLAQAMWDGIKDGAQKLWDYLTESVQAPFDKLKSVMNDWWNWAKNIWDSAIAKAKEYLGVQAKAGSASGGNTPTPQKNAAGGHIRGKGTGTSDSILSWLSNGEFVVKAKAVQHYGPQLLSAINNMRLPRFNAGGLAQAAQTILMPSIPRFAAGGPVAVPAGGGGRPMVLNIDGQSIGGLTANGSAVDALTKYAAQRAVRTAGRKPLWFKG